MFMKKGVIQIFAFQQIDTTGKPQHQKCSDGYLEISQENTVWRVSFVAVHFFLRW